MLPARTRIFRFQPLTPQEKELAITESSLFVQKLSKVDDRGIEVERGWLVYGSLKIINYAKEDLEG
jgi:hypothetical protein